MLKKTISYASLIGVFALGCDKAADEQKAANEAQREANEKIQEAEREARDKQVSAQAEADKQIANANADFMKMREQFRHDTTKALVEIDEDIAELEAELKTRTGKEKADLEAKLPAIRTQREQFTRDYQAVETASATTWDATKARMDKELSALKKAIDDVD